MNTKFNPFSILMRFTRFTRLIFVFSLFLFFWIAFIFSDEWAIHFFRWTAWRPHSLWVFESNFGNAWTVSFDYTPVGTSYPKANLSGTGISGFFWSDTTGWAEFTWWSYMIPRITTSGVRDIWDASGYVWSQYAWWSTLSGVEYYPDIATLSWWLWSDTVGIIPINTIAENIGLWFVGRVKIFGNIAGKNIYSLNIPDASQAQSFDISTVTTELNRIKKNISINTRNSPNASNLVFAAPTQGPLKDTLYYSNTGSSDVFLNYSDVESSFNTLSSPRTLVVVGWDVYMNTGIILLANTPPHSIIVMKNDLGKGWNIYIKSDVTKIYASMVTEGSLYSGRRLWGAWDYYNADKSRTTSLPNYQLYIKGTLISHNTIGGAWLTTSSKCPFTVTTCTYDIALRYDFNYFRDFQTGAVLPITDLPLHRGYPNTTQDSKSLIIEYDGRIASDPPPNL